MKEGIITYLEEQYKKMGLTLKKIPFDIGSINASFKDGAENLIAKKAGTDYSNVSAVSLREPGFIKVDKEGNLYIELESYGNIRLLIKNGYIKLDTRGKYVDEEELKKEIIKANQAMVGYILNSGYAHLLAENLNDTPDPIKLVKNDFKLVLTEAKKMQDERDRKIGIKKCDKLIQDFGTITFNDPDQAPKSKANNKDVVSGSTSHKDIPAVERFNMLLALKPDKVLKAKGSNTNSMYLVCWYKIDKTENGNDKYAMVMEPSSSYGYTKTAYFEAEQGIRDEQFVNLATMYLELDRTDVTALANMTRTCHSTIDRFSDTVDALLFDEYNNPKEKSRISFCKKYSEVINPSCSYSRR